VKTMKIKFLLIIFIVLMIFSCKAQKKTNSGGQDKSDSENNKTSEVNIYLGEQEKTAGITGFDEVKASLYARMDDIDKALQVWTRAKKYPFNEDGVRNIIYGNGRFVAAGSIRLPLAYSDDGDTWYPVESDAVEKPGIDGMAFGKGRFVVASYGNKMAFSNDGETWKRAENGGIGNYYVNGIAYGNGCFVTVGCDRSGEGIIGYSYDGETWMLAENDLNIRYYNCIAYGNGMFIAGAEGGKAAFSNDGITWEALSGSPFDDLDVRIITYGNGRFVAFCSYFQGYNSTTFFSDNGMDWKVVSNDPVDPIYNIFYANGVFITGSHSARMSYSVDGDTWYPLNEKGFTIKALAGTGDNIGGIAYGKGRFVMGAGNGLGGSSKIAWCDMPEILNDAQLDNLPEDDEGNEVKN
jgi:hypothetical protein